MNLPTCTVACLILASAFSLVAGCETNAATGRSQFLLMNRSQEIQLGLEAAPQMVTEHGGEINNAAVRAYVTEVGAKMAAVTESDNPTLPWTFTVLNSNVINAFALPGGKVFISRGLLQRMTNEAQLAGVLGHEIGHVTAKHVNDRMVSGSVAGAVTGVLASILTEGLGGQAGQVAPQVVEMGGEAVVLRFGRDQELEADRFGMRYMAKVGYNPKAQRQVMEILGASMGTIEGSEWFSTHPYPQTRIEQIDSLLATEFASVVNSNTHVFNAEQFQQRCLRLLPPVTNTPVPGSKATHRDATTLSPILWCALCRDQQQHVSTGASPGAASVAHR